MERILVVEDDSFFREVFSDLLKEDGYEVDVASSGEEALEMLNGQKYQVVVTDLVMQGLSGLDILARVKQLDPAIDVIMVTGHANMETAILALKNGARDYLVKPINHDEFKHTVALCIEQQRLLDENEELKGLINLFQVSQTVANCMDLERLSGLVLDSLAKELGVSRGLGYFLEGEELVLRELKGFNEVNGKILGEIVRKNFDLQEEKSDGFVLLKNFITPEDSVGIDSLAGIQEAMLLFVRSKSTLQGIVILFNNNNEPFPEEINYKNLSFLLDQSSLAFENAVRYATAKNLLNVDELTELYNYRFLETALERELKRAERSASCLAVLFLDIDQFKNVNDSYGHLVGSKVLRELGGLLKNSVREVDTVIRYGGDEFTILLVETPVAGTAIVAERIRNSVENHQFLANEGYDIRITISAGYACFPDHSRNKTELIELADRAMYRGKADGKNRVIAASTP